MACLRKRKGKWVVDYRIGGVRKTPSFGTKGEAEAFKRELLLRPINIATGFKAFTEIALKDATQEYLECITINKAAKTHGVDRVSLNRLSDFFKNQMLSEVSLKELEMLQANLLKKLNPATVNRQFNVIRHFFKKCLEWDYIRENPTLRLAKVKEVTKAKTPLTDLQINAILQALPGWATDAYFFITRTGLRRGQACALKWADIDLSRRVFETRSIKGGYEKVYEIPMTEDVFSLVMEKWNLKERNTQKSEYVLLGPNNEAMKPLSLSQAVSRLREKLGIPNAGIHILRHTLLTRLGESNNNGATIQRIAGHSSLQTTQRYLHPNREETRRSLQALEEHHQIKRKGIVEKVGS